MKKDNKAAYTLGSLLGVLLQTYILATILLVIVGATSPMELPQFGLAGRQPPFCCVFFLTLLIGYFWRSETNRSAFLESFHA